MKSAFARKCVQIGTSTVSINPTLQIRLSPDRMFAYLGGLAAESADRAAPTVADVLAELAGKGVTHGIDNGRIANLLAACASHVLEQLEPDPNDQGGVSGVEYCIARGQAAKPGDDAVLRWEIEITAADPWARVVLPEQQLALLNAASSGVSGFTVLGKTLHARAGQRVSLLPGPGVDLEITEEGERLIARWMGVAEFDGRVLSIDPRLTVSADAMSARLDVFARSAQGAIIGAERIVDLLATHGIVAGIDRLAIDAAVAKVAEESKGMLGSVLVASGREPQPGKDAHLMINRKGDAVGQLLAHGRIDFHERDYPWNVRVGEAIGYLIDARPGVDGETVRGEPLPAPAVKSIAVELDGLERQARGKLVAQRDGALIIDGSRLSVVELLVLAGDLDQHTGNIRCDLPVHVKGDVVAGFVLESHKDVIVERNVEDATLRAGGSVTVKGGVRGRACQIFSPRDVSMAFVEGSSVLANGDIRVATSAINSDLTANGSVRIGAEKSALGTLLGGVTRARELVDVAILGAGSFARTQVIVGQSSETRLQIEEIDQELAACETELNQLQQLQQRLAEQADAQRDSVMPKVVATRAQVLARMDELGTARATLLQTLRDESKACVKVRRQCHPGVVVVIHEHRYEVNEPLGPGTFTCESGAVLFVPGLP